MNHPNYSELDETSVWELVRQFKPGAEEVCLKLLDGGNANTNYRVDVNLDGGAMTYLLKVCDEKSPEELRKQVQAVNALRAVGFRTCYPQAGPSGKFVHTLDSGTGVLLMDWMPGMAGTVGSLSVPRIAKLGQSLGHLSLVPTDGLHLPSFAMGVEQMDCFLSGEVPAEMEEHDFVKLLRLKLLALRDVVLDPRLPRGYVHGDVFPDNVVFDGDLPAIVDFEEVCEAPLVLDVAMTIVGCCYSAENALVPERVSAFLKAYGLVRPLTAEERASLPHFLIFSAMSIAFWRFRQYNVRYPTLGRGSHYKAMVSRMQADYTEVLAVS